MIPKYAFIVMVDYRRADKKVFQQSKSFDTLPVATAFHVSIQRRNDVCRSQLMMILDSHSKSDGGNDGSAS